MDDESFAGQLGPLLAEITPLKAAARVDLARQAVPPEVQQRKREAAVVDDTPLKNPLSGEFIEPVDPNAILAFKRPGIQNGVFKNLRLGKYPLDARLDLHNLTVEQARAAVVEFIADCTSHDIRSALITHGKGEGRLPQPAVLKSCIAHWLPQLSSIQAFHSAQKHHGAAGATYILIRKSDKKRQDDVERLQKRR